MNLVIQKRNIIYIKVIQQAGFEKYLNIVTLEKEMLGNLKYSIN